MASRSYGWKLLKAKFTHETFAQGKLGTTSAPSLKGGENVDGKLLKQSQPWRKSKMGGGIWASLKLVKEWYSSSLYLK
ncbi:hypothetical protein E3N88_35056 [Mikania micrantha]|uniref:Uncharacterized protein n=1 Tax=Mikania micrantha TaxID=192012 RepID=A0A5N6M0U4_9ASTR|nr:hypothetical protein E3N88_35056 [Mikania micrantha]